jgi:hypothetical protein
MRLAYEQTRQLRRPAHLAFAEPGVKAFAPPISLVYNRARSVQLHLMSA